MLLFGTLTPDRRSFFVDSNIGGSNSVLSLLRLLHYCKYFENRNRYILARHGLDPRILAGRGGISGTVPIRIGDVLVLPERSFQADASEKDSSLNNENSCVWHGFLGTWKEEIAEEGQSEDGGPTDAVAGAARD